MKKACQQADIKRNEEPESLSPPPLSGEGQREGDYVQMERGLIFWTMALFLCLAGCASAIHSTSATHRALLPRSASAIQNTSAEPLAKPFFCDEISAEISVEYAEESYIVGIGVVTKTDDSLKDKTVAEVLARLEIAKRIKVQIKETSLDQRICESGSGKLFTNGEECRNAFTRLVQETVDVFLEGSRIVNHGEKNGLIYAVAVLPRIKAVEALDRNLENSVHMIKEGIKKAQGGDKDSLQKAHEEYMKAIVYDGEKKIIEGGTSRSSDAFEEMEEEIAKLKGK